DCLRPSSSNRGEDSIALIVEPTMVQPVPELRAISRRALTTSVPTLDRILGSFDAGKVTLIDSGSDFVFHLTTLLCVRAVMEGHEVVFLDGGNSVDPHGMVALGKRAGLTREEILPRVHVARTFTCHQMTTLILDMLDKKIEETQAGLVVLACLPTMYLDGDVGMVRLRPSGPDDLGRLRPRPTADPRPRDERRLAGDPGRGSPAPRMVGRETGVVVGYLRQIDISVFQYRFVDTHVALRME